MPNLSAAIISALDAISHRVSSTIGELEGIIKKFSPTNHRVQHLLTLTTKLEQLKQSVENLRAYLLEASAVSPAVQNALDISVYLCSDAAKVTGIQIHRLQPDRSLEKMNVDILLECEEQQAANARLFTLIAQFPLNAQEHRFMALQGGQVLDRAVRASERVIGRGDVTLYPTQTSPPLSEGTTEVESYPGMELQSQVEYRSDDPKGRAKTSTTFLSSLSDSFKAATASFRAKPEPIVIAMCQSAKFGNVKHIRGLIAQGANVNGKDEEGYTPLICAARANQLDAVQVLIHVGADLTMKDSRSGKGMPPLFHAAECEHVSIAETLLNSGADPNACDIMGKSLIAMIISNTTIDNTRQPEIARMAFQRGCNPSQSDSWGEPLLSHVMIKGNVYLLQAFLEYGADPNKRIKRQETPLLYALDHGRLDQFRMILKYGADPNKADAQGRTPLLEVLQMDAPDVVQELLMAGANVNQLGQVRPLSLARLLGNQETVRMLVSWGAEAPSRPSLATHEDQATGGYDNQRFSSAEDDMLPAYM